MRNYQREILLLLIVAIVAFSVFWSCGRFYGKPENVESHAWLHQQLALTQEQEKKLDIIEKTFHEQAVAIEADIRQSNQELAKILSEDQRYNERVALAVERVHHAQGQLQKAAIDHFFAMRSVLTPEQAKKLNKLAVDALTTIP